MAQSKVRNSPDPIVRAPDIVRRYKPRTATTVASNTFFDMCSLKKKYAKKGTQITLRPVIKATIELFVYAKAKVWVAKAENRNIPKTTP